MERRWRQLITCSAALLAAAAAAWGHPAVSAVAIVKVTPDRRVEVTLVHDGLAYALNDTPARISDPQMYSLLDGPAQDLAEALADGRDRFASGFRLAADGTPLAVELVRAPDLEAVRRWKAENPARQLPCKLEFVVRATLPAGASVISLKFPAVLGEVILSVDRPGVEPVYLPLAPGETAPEIDVRMAGGTTNPVGTLGLAWRYIKFGFGHIVPEGPDHALFVLGLFLLSPRFKPVLWQITAFTVAHTITLTLTTLHIVGLSSRIIEPTIAASIAFVGVENLLTTKVHAWRPAVAFVFGLVHGMGVATAFNEAGFPAGQLVPSLAAFTVGIEGGHLAVLAGAFLVLGWWRDKPWYRHRVAIPLSLVIAAIAVFWMVRRVMGPG